MIIRAEYDRERRRFDQGNVKLLLRSGLDCTYDVTEPLDQSETSR